MNRIYSYLVLSTLCILNLTSQSINWEEQIITDRSEILQNFAQAEDGSATIIGYGNVFSRTTDGGESWQDAGIFSEGDAFDYQSISFSGKMGFAAAMTSFKVIDHPAGTSSDLIANSPLLKTEDGGITWSLITTRKMGSGSDSRINLSAIGNYNVKFTAIKVIDANTIYVGAYWKDVNAAIHQNVFKSIDGGDSWESILPDNGGNAITSMVEYNDHLYIGGKTTLYKVNIATDAVNNLYPIIDEGEDDAMYFWNMSISGNEIIIPSSTDSIFTTSDEGASFTAIPNIGKGNKVYKHDANNIIVCAGKNDTKATSDGGQNWTSISAGESLWNCEVIGDSLVALAKKEIYTMALSDIGSGNFAWTSKTISDVNGNLKSMATVGDTTYITGYNDIFLRSVDGAQTFTEVTLPSKSDMVYSSVDIEMRGLSQGKGQSCIATSRRHRMVDYPTGGPADIYRSGFIFKTADNWSTFTIMDDSKVGAAYENNPSMNPNADGCYSQDYATAECIDDTTMYVFVQWYDTITSDAKIKHGGVFRTRDGGENWDSITTSLRDAFIQGINFKNENGYIFGNKTFLKTTNGDKTITSLYSKLTDLGATKPFVQDVIEYGDTLYVLTTADGAFVSYDAGETFTTINEITGAAGFIAIDADSWMTLGGSTKSNYSNDSGANWIYSYPGSSVFSTGGIYNGDIIALCKSKIYKQNVDDLDSESSSIKNAAPTHNAISVILSNNEIQIQADNVLTGCSIYSISGKIIHKAAPNNSSYSVNTSSFAKGIYLVCAESNKTISTKKIIID